MSEHCCVRFLGVHQVVEIVEDYKAFQVSVIQIVGSTGFRRLLRRTYTGSSYSQLLHRPRLDRWCGWRILGSHDYMRRRRIDCESRQLLGGLPIVDSCRRSSGPSISHPRGACRKREYNPSCRLSAGRHAILTRKGRLTSRFEDCRPATLVENVVEPLQCRR